MVCELLGRCARLLCCVVDIVEDRSVEVVVSDNRTVLVRVERAVVRAHGQNEMAIEWGELAQREDKNMKDEHTYEGQEGPL